MNMIKTIIAWLLEDTSPTKPQPISQRRMNLAVCSAREDRIIAREWLGD